MHENPYPETSAQEIGYFFNLLFRWFAKDGIDIYEREKPWRKPVSSTKVTQYGDEYVSLFHISPFYHPAAAKTSK